MSRLMPALRRFAGSLAGRIALILVVGTSLAATAALLLAEQTRNAVFERIHADQLVTSAVDVMNRIERAPQRTERQLRTAQLFGARLLAPGIAPHGQADPLLTGLLAERIRPGQRATLSPVPRSVCAATDPFQNLPRTAGFDVPVVIDCWLLSYDRGGGTMRVTLDLPRLRTPPSRTGDPVFLLATVLGVTLLSLVVARLATAPLRRLAAASEAFARSVDADPVAVTGPSDVAEALATFNLMQERVREGLRERARMLAAISHDLQTPLTRLRLRLEQVDDPALRERLVKDLSATLAMVKRGLDLARSGDSAENWSVVDLDSLLSSLADDAAEFGQPVTFAGGCGARVRVKPDALARCLGNLIDNAVNYGSGAALACSRVAATVAITVTDEGPGMPPDLLARAFEPFVRGPGGSSGDGTGIGLTIARGQAQAIGGALTLRNGHGGGLVAELRLPLAEPAPRAGSAGHRPWPRLNGGLRTG